MISADGWIGDEHWEGAVSAWMVGGRWLRPFSHLRALSPPSTVLASTQPLLPFGPGSSATTVALRSAVPSLALTSLLCLGFALCASVPILPLQYVTFILQVISRSFLYGGNAAFLTLA